MHHELPDILVPYKRYDSESIEKEWVVVRVPPLLALVGWHRRRKMVREWKSQEKTQAVVAPGNSRKATG